MVTITEFLLARVAEDEAAARSAMADRWGEIHRDGINWAHDLQSVDRDATEAQDDHARQWWPGRVLVECEAKRAIIKQHEAWPVLVDEEPPPPELLPRGTDLDSLSIVVTRRIAWLTEREYVKRFGTEAPTGPMISALAAVYRDHPDYLQEWDV